MKNAFLVKNGNTRYPKEILAEELPADRFRAVAAEMSAEYDTLDLTRMDSLMELMNIDPEHPMATYIKNEGGRIDGDIPVRRAQIRKVTSIDPLMAKVYNPQLDLRPKDHAFRQLRSSFTYQAMLFQQSINIAVEKFYAALTSDNDSLARSNGVDGQDMTGADSSGQRLEAVILIPYISEREEANTARMVDFTRRAMATAMAEINYASDRLSLLDSLDVNDLMDTSRPDLSVEEFVLIYQDAFTESTLTIHLVGVQNSERNISELTEFVDANDPTFEILGSHMPDLVRHHDYSSLGTYNYTELLENVTNLESVCGAQVLQRTKHGQNNQFTGPMVYCNHGAVMDYIHARIRFNSINSRAPQLHESTTMYFIDGSTLSALTNRFGLLSKNTKYVRDAMTREFIHKGFEHILDVIAFDEAYSFIELDTAIESIVGCIGVDGKLNKKVAGSPNIAGFVLKRGYVMSNQGTIPSTFNQPAAMLLRALELGVDARRLASIYGITNYAKKPNSKRKTPARSIWYQSSSNAALRKQLAGVRDSLRFYCSRLGIYNFSHARGGVGHVIPVKTSSRTVKVIL